ncbi:MAG: hypothetical protein NTY86_04715 [Deltaproteobacteria bacterium]|nr:hypothetical protein [Deltaproteobacteria bacterium]
MEGAGVVDVYRERRDLEDVVLEAHEGLVGPDAQAPVLGEAVAADPRAGEEIVLSTELEVMGGSCFRGGVPVHRHQ